MLVAIALCLVGFFVVLYAWYQDTARVGPPLIAPDWDVLPAPGDIARLQFPLATAGYDPASVELHLEALARAYSALYDVTPDEVRREARQHAAMRAGMEPVEEADEVVEPVAVPMAPAGSDADALRTEVALAQLDDLQAHRDDAQHERHPFDGGTGAN